MRVARVWTLQRELQRCRRAYGWPARVSAFVLIEFYAAVVAAAAVDNDNERRQQQWQ